MTRTKSEQINDLQNKTPPPLDKEELVLLGGETEPIPVMERITPFIPIPPDRAKEIGEMRRSLEKSLEELWSSY